MSDDAKREQATPSTPSSGDLVNDLEVTLTESDAAQVKGGADDVSVNRVKTSDKHQKAVLDFLKG